LNVVEEEIGGGFGQKASVASPKTNAILVLDNTQGNYGTNGQKNNKMDGFIARRQTANGS
jgi:hypothetical protein